MFLLNCLQSFGDYIVHCLIFVQYHHPFNTIIFLFFFFVVGNSIKILDYTFVFILLYCSKTISNTYKKLY